MRSIDSKKHGQHPTQIADPKNIDEKIISLFPTLDFNRYDIHDQKGKGIKNRLIILAKATQKPVTKYSLTVWNASPRFGGQVAENALKKIEKLGLLEAKEVVSDKHTIRKDFWLTPKGILFCLVFTKVQSKKEISKLLNLPKNKSKKLIFVMKLINDASIKKGKDPEVSPLVPLLEKMATKGYNFETLSEEEIADSLRMAERETFLDSFNTDLFNSMALLPLALSQQDKKTNEIFKNNLSDAAKLFSDPTLSLTEKELLSKTIANMTKNTLSFFTSPEFSFWIKSGQKNFTSEDLSNKLKEKLEIEKNPDIVLEKVEKLFCMMRQVLFDQLFADFCNS